MGLQQELASSPIWPVQHTLCSRQEAEISGFLAVVQFTPRNPLTMSDLAVAISTVTHRGSFSTSASIIHGS
jgi:hypothetical protein